MEHLNTDDPEFIEKYDAELAAEGKWLRLGAVRKRQGEDVEAVMDDLPGEVRQMTPPAAS